jgi:deoxyribodipyrimidine photolyase-related protein
MATVSPVFRRLLRERNPDPSGRRWVFVAYDQLTDRFGPLADEDPRGLGIVVVENPEKPRRRPYHQQKLALLLSNQRQFALEQAARGVAVELRVGGYRDALAAAIRDHGPMRAMTPAERELRHELVDLPGLTWIPHRGWLSEASDFAAARTRDGWKMDAFYRAVRQRTGVLMVDGRPVGGKFSFDTENRERWNGQPPAPRPPTFTPDAVTLEVGELIRSQFGDHPGRLDLSTIPTTAADAAAALDHLDVVLPGFGPYEDAMSERSRTLFHSLLSPLINLSRVSPADAVARALASTAPLASVEGFVRQILGWREFVHHVHVATDGLRTFGSTAVPERAASGDGGWARARGAAWAGEAGFGGADPSFLDAHHPVPPAFWGAPSGLRCLDHTVATVWDTGHTHHITRLMILSNLATLLAISPRDLADWFWVAYIDAYDWVVEPNVLGMGTFAVGPLMTTKPYVSGAPYLDRMSDHCRACAFHPKKNCPITPLYWAFLDENRDRLAGNPRMATVLASVDHREPGKKVRDRQIRERLWAALQRGRPVRPADIDD